MQYEDLVHEAGSGSVRGIGGMSSLALKLHYDTDQPKEGGNALREKRGPDFLGYTVDEGADGAGAEADASRRAPPSGLEPGGTTWTSD